MIARRTINPGEELTLCYVDPRSSRSQRRQILRESYGFWCGCPKCVREEGKAEESGGALEEGVNKVRRVVEVADPQDHRAADESEHGTCGCDHNH
jgi:hypothetical protein